MNRYFKVSLMIFCLSLTFTEYLLSQQVDSPSLKALIVTGQNNHDWERSTPILKQILEQTDLFTVNIAATPPGEKSMDSFHPRFADYDVVVMDYNGADWPDATLEAFFEYVRSGGGVVMYHAASNSFPNWKEFNRIAGLGGWRGRDETFGPYIRWSDGKIVRDTSPGIGGSHGPAHEFQIIIRDKEHPITRGLPEKWRHTTDELYDRLRGPAENIMLLATAYSDPEKRGTGEHEPILFTIQYGQGRVFHTVLGHSWQSLKTFPAMECAGFITTFQRGTEWAATGEVTQEIPFDFPTATSIRRWKDFKPFSLTKLLEEIGAYEYGNSRESLTELSNYIRFAIDSPDLLLEIENQCLELLRTEISLAGKQFICKQLSLMGSEKAIPVLTEMLLDKTTSDMARYALERIPGTAVDEALRGALSGTDGLIKIGIINTLGQRRDLESVPLIRGLIYGPDPEIAQTSIAALGQITGPEATAALAEAKDKTTGTLRLLVLDAYLKCADQLMIKGELSSAYTIYQQLYSPQEPNPIRIGALRGMVYSRPADSEDIIVTAIKEAEPEIQSGAIMLVHELPESDEIGKIVRTLPTLSIASQVQLLTALGFRGDSAYRETVLSATQSTDPEVQIAAIRAMKTVGSESDVGLLVNIAAGKKGAESDAARESLYLLKGAAVDETILSSIPKADPKAKVELIRSTGSRKISASVNVLLETAKEPDTDVRVESINSLKILGDQRHLPSLIELLVNAKTEKERTELENTVVTIFQTIPEQNRRAEAVVNILPGVTEIRVRSSLLQVLGKIGDSSTLPILQEALKDKNSELQIAAIRSLSEWSTAEPMGDLLEVIQFSETAVNRILAKLNLGPPPYSNIHRTLALRGYIRLIGLDTDRPDKQTVILYREAINLAWNDNEKKMVLSELSKMKSPEALKTAVSFLDNSSLQKEAEVAVLKLVDATYETTPQMAKKALENIIQITNNDEIRENAQELIKMID